MKGFPAGLFDGGAGVIREERQGTEALVKANGARLPMDGTTTPDEQERCRAVGITLGATVRGDALFREATLPTGWATKPSPDDHRTTLLCDDKGQTRGVIWYKAASYDRKANMYLRTRYAVEGEYPGEGRMRTVAKDRSTGDNVWESAWLESPARKKGATPADWQAYEEAQQAQREAAVAILDGLYPDWQNVAAYW